MNETSNPDIRIIRGRRIERVRGEGRIVFEEVTQSRVERGEKFDPRTGRSRIWERHHPAVVHWRYIVDPDATMQSVNESVQGRPFDPREPSPLHDEIDRARAAGFEGWAAELAVRSKLRPRLELAGIALGKVLVTRGVRALPVGDDELRELVRRHAVGDWGDHGRLDQVELDDDSRWCPPLFDQAIQNAAAVEAGRGLVRSKYLRTYHEHRGPESVDIITHIGQTTVVYTPFRDGC